MGQVRPQKGPVSPSLGDHTLSSALNLAEQGHTIDRVLAFCVRSYRFDPGRGRWFSLVRGWNKPQMRLLLADGVQRHVPEGCIRCFLYVNQPFQTDRRCVKDRQNSQEFFRMKTKAEVSQTLHKKVTVWSYLVPTTLIEIKKPRLPTTSGSERF